MDIPRTRLKEIILEELSKKDKDEIKKIVTKELDSALNKAVKEELEKVLKTKDVKSDIGEIAKQVIKKLYKDLSFHHPYIIDRIKV
jgi:hypothetical protein